MKKKGIAWTVFGVVLIADALYRTALVLSDPIAHTRFVFFILLGGAIGIASLRTGLKYLRPKKEADLKSPAAVVERREDTKDVRWAKEHKGMTGVAVVASVSFLLLMLGVDWAITPFVLASLAAVGWGVWALLCIMFPALRRKKEAE